MVCRYFIPLNKNVNFFTLDVILLILPHYTSLFLRGPDSNYFRLVGLLVLVTTAWASRVVQLVKNLPAMRETWVRSLGWEDPLEKGKATHFSILAWRIPWTVYSMGSQRFRHH